MPSIISSISLREVASNLKLTGGVNTTTKGEPVLFNKFKVLDADETLVLGDVVAPDHVVLRLMSGDDCLVGFDGSTYPMRLTGADDTIALRLNAKGSSEISRFVAEADVAGSLAGTYLVLREYGNTIVWPWFDTGAGVAAVGSIAYGSPANTDTVEVDGTTFTKVASAPGANEFTNLAELVALVDALTDVTAVASGTSVNITAAVVGAAGNSITLSVGGGNTGTMAVSGATLTGGVDDSTAPTPPGTERLIRVAISGDETAEEIAAVLASTLAADSAFFVDYTAGTDTLDVVVAGPGNMTTATEGTTGWAAPTVVQNGSASQVVHLKSVGVSHVFAAVSSF